MGHAFLSSLCDIQHVAKPEAVKCLQFEFEFGWRMSLQAAVKH